ncbi:hypothetical protein [Lacrimispora sp.]
MSGKVWKQFYQQYVTAFISGTYGGEAEDMVLAQFDQALCKSHHGLRII